MSRQRAFFVGLLCGTCAAAVVALLARRVEPPAAPAIAAPAVVRPMPDMDYAYYLGLPKQNAPTFGAQPVPEPAPEGRTFNGQPLYIVPLGAVAAR